ncbi:MAG: DUF6639 family protein [Desulforhopalus sp.]
MSWKIFRRTAVKPGGRWSSSVYPVRVVVCFLAIINLVAGSVKAGEFACPEGIPIHISASDNQMVGDICYAAMKAIAFLARYELRPQRPIDIEIIETLINSHGYLAYGSFDRQKEVIQLMSYGAILKTVQSPMMYEQPFDMEHYRGAIAHEIAHAVFHQNTETTANRLTNAAQEYLAHATQLATLSFARRREIIAANSVGPWESGDSISEIYMGLNPTGFAVKSYLHLTRLEQPLPFIKLLLKHKWFYISVP